MATTREFDLAWMGQYKASSNSYFGGGSPIRVGGSSDYQSYCGFPTSVRDALNSSKTTPQLKIKIYVTDSAEFDFGAHKETYNKASGTMPWYTYIGLHPNWGTGWQTQDLTSAFMNDYKNGTYHGIVLYGLATSSGYGEASNSGSTRVKIQVIGDWNDPPNPPTISYPDGGEVVDTSITFDWSNATDPDGNLSHYSLAYKEGDGSGWYYVDTSNTTSQYTFNTTNWAEGSSARFAVRSVDSDGEKSNWVYSNYFTINHNQAPAKPTQLSPANGAVEDRTGVIRFDWKHNDDGTQAGWRIAWRTVASNGTKGGWNYIPNSTDFTNSTSQYYNAPANTFPFSDIEWQVQTKDQQGLQSAYSNPVIFKASEPTDAPTILSPSNGSSISTTRVTVSWSSLNQLEYELILYDGDGATLWSQTKSSSNKTVTIPYDLTNNLGYEVHLRVKDSNSLIWSSYAVSAFTTAFTPPIAPRVKRFESAGDGIVNLFVSAGEGNLFPAMIIGEGEVNPDLQFYSDDTGGVVINDSSSITLPATDQSGVEYYLTSDDIPLEQGATVTMSTTTDVKGGRMYCEPLDSNGDSLGAGVSSTNIQANSQTGQWSITTTVPANCTQIRFLWYNTADVSNSVTHDTMSIQIYHSSSQADSLSIFRREYTPTGTAPWVKVAEELPLYASWLDYTPASGVLYEYKVQAVNSGNETTSDSPVRTHQVDFTETFLQEAHNLSSIVIMNFATSRELDLEIDSQLQKFAGRRDPVREFGENENIGIDIEWEVDTYADVRNIREMLRRRDVLLYRDGQGRRYWVTTDNLNVEDKPVYGFVLSTTLIVTSYDEDLTTNGGELA